MNLMPRSFWKQRAISRTVLLSCVWLVVACRMDAASDPHRGVSAANQAAPNGTARLAETQEQSLATGQALFRGLCSGCHGGAGRGGKGPDLTDNRWIHGSSDSDIAGVIQNGVPKTTMKKMGDSLKPDQIRKL